MKTITLLLSLGSIFLLIASCEQSACPELVEGFVKNNGSVQDAFVSQNSNNIIKPDSCCDTIRHSKKGETDINEETRIINYKQTIKEGRIELFSFVEKFEKISVSISDADLLILGKKYLEKLEAGGSFTNDQIQTAVNLLLSPSVSTFANCAKFTIDKPQQNVIKKFYSKSMYSTNKRFYLEIKNKKFIDVLNESKSFVKAE